MAGGIGLCGAIHTLQIGQQRRGAAQTILRPHQGQTESIDKQTHARKDALKAA